MKITGWTWPENPKFEDLTDHYISDELWTECTKMVVEEIRKHGYKISGYEHQDKYAPVFDDKYYYLVSYRSWGEIMHEAYPNTISSYIEWAWRRPEEKGTTYPDVIE